jgi:hypothetical protein
MGRDAINITMTRIDSISQHENHQETDQKGKVIPVTDREGP